MRAGSPIDRSPILVGWAVANVNNTNWRSGNRHRLVQTLLQPLRSMAGRLSLTAIQNRTNGLTLTALLDVVGELLKLVT